jgi:hypothetical protein
MVATRFYPGAQKTFRLSWQAFRLQLRASIATTNRSAFALSQSLATPFADPFVGLDGRNLRDAESYTEKKFFDQLFVCFIFLAADFLLTSTCQRSQLPFRKGVQYAENMGVSFVCKKGELMK